MKQLIAKTAYALGIAYMAAYLINKPTDPWLAIAGAICIAIGANIPWDNQ
jgi:hypothetical protein